MLPPNIRFLYRVIAVILIGAFVSYDLAWAYPDASGTLAVPGLQNRDVVDKIKAAEIARFIEKKLAESGADEQSALNEVCALKIRYPGVFEDITLGAIMSDSKPVDVVFHMSKKDGHIAIRCFDTRDTSRGGSVQPGYEEVEKARPVLPDSAIHIQIVKKRPVAVVPAATASSAPAKIERTVPESISQDRLEEKTALRVSWWLEELPRVGVPFGALAILNAVNTEDMALNVQIFSIMAIVFGAIFFLRHLLQERAPPKDADGDLALLAAPALAAVSGIIISVGSVLLITNPLAQFLTALPVSMAAHLAINLVVRMLRGREINAGYASLSNGDDTKWMSSFDRNKAEWDLSGLRTISLKKLKLSLYAIGAVAVLGCEIAFAVQNPLLGSWLIFLTVALQASMHFREWRAISDLQNKAFTVLRNMQLRFDTFKDEMGMRDISKLELEAIDQIFGWDCYKYRLSKKDGKLYYVYDRGTLVDSSYSDNPRRPTDKDEKEYFWSNMARYHSEVNPITKRAVVEQLQREYDGWIVGPNGELKGLYIKDRSKLPHGYTAKNIDIDRKKYGDDVDQMLFWAEEEDDDIVGYAFIDWKSYRKFVSLKNLSDNQLDKLRDRLIAAQDIGDLFNDHYLYRLHKDFTLQGIAKEGALNDSSYTKDPRPATDGDEKQYVCDGLLDYWWGPGRGGRSERARELKKDYPGWIIGPNGELLGLYIKDRRKLPAGINAKNLRSDERAYGDDVNQMLFWARRENEGLMLYLCVDWIDQRRARDFVPLKNLSPKRLATISDIITLLGNTVRYEKKNLEGRLHTERMAIKDGLTGLYNQTYFIAAVNQLIGRTRTQRGNHSIGIIMIDLDHFKNVNDGHGHEAGNRVLRQAAEIIMKNLRSDDVPCRYGGEELAIVMPDTSEKDAVKMAERLRKAMEAAEFTDENGKLIPKIVPGSGEPMGTISVGVAAATKKEVSQGNFTAQDLIAEADKAMYRSKRDGRNRVTVYSEMAASDSEEKAGGLPAVFGISAAGATGIGMLIVFGVLIAHEVTRHIYELCRSQGLVSDNRFMRAILKRSLWPPAVRRFIFKYISEPLARAAVRVMTMLEASTFRLEKDIKRIGERVESLRKHVNPPVMAVLSDMHGEVYRLEEAIEKAEKTHGAERFIFLGDAIDARDDYSGVMEKRKSGKEISSRNTIRHIKALIESGKGEFLLGNHEICLIGSVSGPDTIENRALFLQWILPENHYGGAHTLREFGVRSPFTVEKIDDFSHWISTGEVKSKLDSQAQALYSKARSNKAMIDVAEWMKKRGRLYLIEDDTLYVHGGIPLFNNGEMCPMINGLTGTEALRQLEEDFREGFINYTDLTFSHRSPLNADSPLRTNPWYGRLRSDRAVRRMLSAFGVKRIVFGHFPNAPAMMFGGKLVNVDGGLSDRYEGESAAFIVTSNKALLQSILFDGRHRRMRQDPADVVVEEFRGPRINRGIAGQIKGLEDILSIKKKRLEALAKKLGKTIAKNDTDLLPPVPQKKKSRKNGNGRKGAPDGFIRKGHRSARIFTSIADDIRLCSGTREYDERAAGLLKEALAKARLSDAERSAVKSRLQKVKNGSFKTYEFLPIVKSEKDFFLGWSNAENEELFLAPELIKHLEARGPPTLVDEYLLHELLCPIMGHYRAVLIQQDVYPDHYNSRSDLLGNQTEKDPYKGILNDVLTGFIKERSAAAAAVKALSTHEKNVRLMRRIVEAAGRRDRAFRIIRHKIKNDEMPDSLRIDDFVKLGAFGGLYLDVSADALQWWDGLSAGNKADLPEDLNNISEPSCEERRDMLFNEFEVETLISKLEERDREIARMYIGGKTLLEIGMHFGFTGERARQRLVEISRELVELAEGGLSRKERKEADREKIKILREQEAETRTYVKKKIKEARQAMKGPGAHHESALYILQDALRAADRVALSGAVTGRIGRYIDEVMAKIKKARKTAEEKARKERLAAALETAKKAMTEKRERAEAETRERLSRVRTAMDDPAADKPAVLAMAKAALYAARGENMPPAALTETRGYVARLTEMIEREKEGVREIAPEEKLARLLYRDDLTSRKKHNIIKNLAAMALEGNGKALELLGVAALEIHELRMRIIGFLCRLPPEISYGKLPLKIDRIWRNVLPPEQRQALADIMRKSGRSMDGYIRQGTEAVKDFEPQLAMIRQNNYTSKYGQKAAELLESALAAGEISSEARKALEEQLQKFRDGSYRIYGFKSIVKAKDDFLLGWNNIAGSELFMAIDVIAELEAPNPKIPPTLTDEYLLHELICPVIGHYHSIRLQQKLFPQHYPDDERLKQQSAENPYKGMLGIMLRLSIDKMKDPILAKIIHDIKDYVVTSGGFAHSVNKKLKKRSIELFVLLKEQLGRGEAPDIDVYMIRMMLDEFHSALEDYQRLTREHDERKEVSEAETNALEEAKSCIDIIDSVERAQTESGLQVSREGSELEDLMAAILILQQYQRLAMFFCVVTKKCLRGDLTIEDMLDTLKKNLPEFVRLKAAIKQMREDRPCSGDARLVSSLEVIIQANDEAISEINSAIRWLGRSMENFSIDEVGKVVRQAEKKYPSVMFKYAVSEEALRLKDVFTYKRILKTVLEGLIDNAYIHSETKQVDVSVSLTKGGELKVDVRDHGKGMSKERQQTIFMPGFSEAKQRRAGTGFGLYTYKESVEATGGNMSFSSKTGEGTTFTFTLPVNAKLNILKRYTNGPLIVVVSGLMGAGRRAVSRVLASRLGLRYINGGFVAKALVAKMLEEKVDMDDEARVTVYAREFLLEKKRLDYSREPVTLDGVDTTAADEQGLSVRDKIKRTFEDSRANEAILHRVTKYHGVRQAIREFYEAEALRVRSLGEYNGLIIRTSEPIRDVAQKEFSIVNVMLLASSRVRAERVKRSYKDIDALDESTGKTNFGAQYSGLKKINTSYRPVADICREALDHIALTISPADPLIRAGTESRAEFETLIMSARRNRMTDHFAERLAAVMDMALRSGTLTSGEGVKISTIAEDIRKGDYAVCGFDSITKMPDDFFLAWNNKEGRELFVASDIVSKLGSIGWPSLANEYLFRSLLGPVLGDVRTLELQQELWPAHYPDKVLLKSQMIERPYNGMVGETLKNMVNAQALAKKPYTRIESEGINVSRAFLTVEDAVAEAFTLCIANGKGRFITSKKEKLYQLLIKTLLTLEDPSTSFERRHIETIKTLLEQMPHDMVKIDFVIPYLEEYMRQGDAEDLRMQLSTVHDRLTKAYQDILSLYLYMGIVHIFRNSLSTVGGFARGLGKKYTDTDLRRFIDVSFGMEKEVGALADQKGKFNTVENLAAFLKGLEGTVAEGQKLLDAFEREYARSFTAKDKDNIRVIREELDVLDAADKEVSLAARSNIGLEQLIEKTDLAITKARLRRPLPEYLRVVVMRPGSDESVTVTKGTPVKVTAQVYIEGYTPQEVRAVGAKEFAETVLKARALTNALSPANAPAKEAWKAIQMRFVGTGGINGHDYIFEATIPADRYAGIADGKGGMSEFGILPQVALRVEDPQAAERWFNCEQLNADPARNEYGNARLVVLPKESLITEEAAPAPSRRTPDEPLAITSSSASAYMTFPEAVALTESVHKMGMNILDDILSRKGAANGNILTNGKPRTIPINIDIFADIPEANSDVITRFLEILALKQLYINRRSKGAEFEFISFSDNAALLGKIEKIYGELDIVRQYNLKLHKENGLQRGFAITALEDDVTPHKERCIFLENRVVALDEASGLCMWAGVLDLALAMTILLDQEELSRKDHYNRLAEFYNKLLASRPEAVESDTLAIFFDDDVQRSIGMAKKLAIPQAGKFDINDLRELYIKMRTLEEAA
ncbi:MAG: diguanylate cyclase [Candidatus Omnitrophica bacterium]|nr:diguanylate cyclase [Candidatus Omnitrophota bacterium]